MYLVDYDIDTKLTISDLLCSEDNCVSVKKITFADNFFRSIFTLQASFARDLTV